MWEHYILFCRYDGARARATSKSTGECVATPRALARSAAMNSAFLAWAEEVASNSVFAEALVSMIVEAALCPASQKARSFNSKYQVMWTGYHRMSISSELSTLWSSSLTTNERNAVFVPHFIQLVTR